MENTNKLTGKDLINVGIYSAMTLVIFFVVGLLTALSSSISIPFCDLADCHAAIPMIACITRKIKKFGCLPITGIIWRYLLPI